MVLWFKPSQHLESDGKVIAATKQAFRKVGSESPISLIAMCNKFTDITLRISDKGSTEV